MAMIRGVGSEMIQSAYRQATAAPQEGGAQGSGFASRLQELVGEVDRLQDRTSDLQTRALQGEAVEVHDVLIASQESGLALTMMIEIRNKLVEAYQELMRMQA